MDILCSSEDPITASVNLSGDKDYTFRTSFKPHFANKTERNDLIRDLN